jgi:type IV secretory pathway protease TraF
MKNIIVPAVFAVFAIGATISSAAVSAAVDPATINAAKSAPVVMPVSQELPFDRYWSKD